MQVVSPTAEPGGASRSRVMRMHGIYDSAQRLVRQKWVAFGIGRLIHLVVTLLVLLVVTFAIVQLIPGNPARLVLGPKASPQAVEVLRHKLGLDEPLVTQFFHYAKGAVRLRLGNSFTTGQSVSSILLQRLPYTLWLDGVALVIMMLIGVLFGLLAGALTTAHRNRWFEMVFMAITGFGGGVPSYVCAVGLSFIFAVTLRIFPVAGMNGASSVVLPALAIALPLSLLLARVVRVATLDVLAQDYIRTARSNRLSKWRIYFRYVLPNVLNAAVSLGGLLFVGIIGGSVVVENVFAWPGLGTLLVQSIPALDYPVIQGATLLLGLIVVLLNTVVDVVRALVDPQAAVGGP